MFRSFFAPAHERMPKDVEDELLAMCRSQQSALRNLSDHMRKDIGFDCGCIGGLSNRG